MCGRFAQIQSRDDYLQYLAAQESEAIAHDPLPLGRYNVAPGTKVLLLNEYDDALHLDPVHWGYAPAWWNKQPLINARVETAATSRMFKSLWVNGRAIVFADGWYEWKREGNVKQPYFIHHQNNVPLLFAAIGKRPFDRADDKEGFLIVTAASDQGLLDIHDRRPLVFTADAAKIWLHQDTPLNEIADIVAEGTVPVEEFAWYPVSKKIGNVKQQGAELIEESRK